MASEVSFKAGSALVYKAVEHSIKVDLINKSALAVVEKINAAGYQAYLVGGCVRDLMLGIVPKDFDVATNATPEQVSKLFNNCRLIGRRFRLAHVNFRKQLIEVATFRSAATSLRDEHLSNEGRILRDNVYGTLEEDALRRDFTVNALYYDVKTHTVIDFSDGVSDLSYGLIKLIGEPETRFREDPVRMLRAVRFSAKLKFNIEEKTHLAIHKLGALLEDISPSRLYDETKKLLLNGHALTTYELLRETNLFNYLFPQTAYSLSKDDELTKSDLKLLQIAMQNTDARIAVGKSVTPAFLFAVLLWPAVRRKLKRHKKHKTLSKRQIFEKVIYEVTNEQSRQISVPRRFTQPMKEIWLMQARFTQKSKSKIQRFLSHSRFRAAYDFLMLKVEAGQGDQVLAQWWTEIQQDDNYKSLLQADSAKKYNVSENRNRQMRKRRGANRKRRS